MSNDRVTGRQQCPRLRYGRVAALGAALLTTAVALLGGFGVLPSYAAGSSRETVATHAAADLTAETAALITPAPSSTTGPTTTGPTTTGPTTTGPAATGPTTTGPTTPAPGTGNADSETALPADSGSGRRAVFSQSRQRVWILDGPDDQVARTYLVSGSVTDNLHPGSYEVYSRSEDAIGVDDSGTMKWFVRFTQGDTGAAIGFHDIPVKDEHPVQNKSALGTPRSHGCIRQKESDALAMWAFARLGTRVVVTA